MNMTHVISIAYRVQFILPISNVRTDEIQCFSQFQFANLMFNNVPGAG